MSFQRRLESRDPQMYINVYMVNLYDELIVIRFAVPNETFPKSPGPLYKGEKRVSHKSPDYRE